jgi:hypothetical protein
VIDFIALIAVIPAVGLMLGLALIPLWERDMKDIERQIEEEVRKESGK